MIVPVILAGGSGTRLWPLSRELYPKQVLRLLSERTMLQDTLVRLEGLPDLHPPIVICNESHRFMVAEQLREIGVTPGAIVLEPVGRNTAPAIAVAALRAAAGNQADPLLLVLPADHYIARPDRLHAAMVRAAALAVSGRLVTFGVVPTAPETGYGYIRRGPGLAGGGYSIQAFVEKPDPRTAAAYLASGEYYWNSGMFVFRAEVIRQEMERLVPEIPAACRLALDGAMADLDFLRLEAGAFGACPSDSIDYAVMEKTELGAMVPLEAGWSDLGSWEALWQVGAKDAAGNVTRGDVLLHDVGSSFVHAESRLVAAVGLDAHIIVETADAVFVAPRGRVQEVKHLVERLKSARRPEALVHRTIYRPWGAYESLVAAERFEVKRIMVRPGARLAFQQHHHRAEHWVVVKGTAKVRKGEEEFLLREDQSTYIPVGIPHRLENPGRIPLELIEVRTGSYLGEDDITRMDDDYGR
jgi:mannose-1-phosphate guanylyltransferase/mannose-6-phosphate isomerase